MATLTVRLATVAGNVTYSFGKGASFKLRVSDLLTNATDLAGGTVSLVSVGNSVNGVTVTSDGTHVYYAGALTADDSFTYTVSGSTCGETATGTVTLQAVSATGSRSIVRLQTGVPEAGKNTLTFAGVPGYQYIAQYATDLNGPWVDFSTDTVGQSGLWTVIDNDATSAERYYRVRTP